MAKYENDDLHGHAILSHLSAVFHSEAQLDECPDLFLIILMMTFACFLYLAAFMKSHEWP
mgnify:FL=1